MENKAHTYDYGSMSLEELLMDYFAAKKCACGAGCKCCKNAAMLENYEMDEGVGRYDGMLYPYPEEAMQDMQDKDGGDDIPADGYVRLLYGELSHHLLPHVDEALNKYEAGGMAYGEGVKRETVAAVACEALEKAAGYIHELHELVHEAGQMRWCGGNLAHELAEAIVINEIYHVRMPNHSKLRFVL